MDKVQDGVEKFFRWEELEDLIWVLTPSHLRRGVSMKIPEAKLGEIEPASPLEVGEGNRST